MAAPAVAASQSWCAVTDILKRRAVWARRGERLVRRQRSVNKAAVSDGVARLLLCPGKMQ